MTPRASGAPYSQEPPEATDAPRVLTRTDGRVRILTLNRPDSRNALDSETRAELIAALGKADADAAIGAVVLTGAGTCFAAGADLRELLERGTDEQREFLAPPHIYSVVEGLRKPVLAALNGHALGAGLELATACDIRICADTAKLGQPEIQLSLIPGGGGTQRLVRLIGRGAAARLVLTGDAIKADEALRIGLVDSVTSFDRVEGDAVRLAQAMARHDPEAIAAAKLALQAAMTEPYKLGLGVETDLFLHLHARHEAKTRIRSFLEKR